MPTSPKRCLPCGFSVTRSRTPQRTSAARPTSGLWPSTSSRIRRAELGLDAPDFGSGLIAMLPRVRVGWVLDQEHGGVARPLLRLRQLRPEIGRLHGALALHNSPFEPAHKRVDRGRVVDQLADPRDQRSARFLRRDARALFADGRPVLAVPSAAVPEFQLAADHLATAHAVVTATRRAGQDRGHQRDDLTVPRGLFLAALASGELALDAVPPRAIDDRGRFDHDTIQLAPPFIATTAELDRLISVLGDALAQVA